MKSKLLVCAAMFAALAATSPANAGIIINGTDYAVGSGTTLSFNGFSDGGIVPGLTADLTLTLTSIVGNTFNVAYSLLNTSTQTGARVVSFGFNVDPNVSGASATGSFDTADLNVNYPVGFGTVEVCAYDGPGGTCTGNGNGATIGGGALTGNLALTFSSPHTSITLSNFVDRYQAFDYNGTNSAIGTPTTPLPEPSTWAMMLIGFGAIGAFMRRGKAADVKGRVSFA